MSAVPFGLALAYLGYVLWSEKRAPAAHSAAAQGRVQLRQAGAD